MRTVAGENSKNKIKCWEIVSVSTVFIVLCKILAGPILEGYGINLAKRDYLKFFPTATARPLSYLPAYLASNISGVQPLGYFIVVSALVIAKIFLIYRVYKSLSYLGLAILLLILLAMPPWFDFMNERYFAAQFSLVLILFGLYFLIKKNQPKLSFIFTLLAGMAYPPIVIAFIFSWSLIWFIAQPRFSVKKYAIGLSGSITFLVYYEIVKKFVKGSYDSQSNGIVTMRNIFHIYRTIYFSSILDSVLIVLAIILISASVNSSFLHRSLFTLSLVVTVPLASFGYAMNSLHVNDPERILFPVTGTFCLVFYYLSSGSQSSLGETKLRGRFRITVVSLFLILSLISIARNSFTWEGYVGNNSKLIHIISDLELSRHFQTLLIIDQTNYFGDVYSLFDQADVLSLALAGQGMQIHSRICNSGERYYQTIASRFPIPAASNCNSLKAKNFQQIVVISKLHPLKYKVLNPPYSNNVAMIKS